MCPRPGDHQIPGRQVGVTEPVLPSDSPTRGCQVRGAVISLARSSTWF